ncbi:VgrG protein [Desulfocucumis palustris]|uniref:VgrG protein n=1 Tax=Desulfocucumis palustris TaxID=1898651 RepID=A0A2L2XLJ0_9FIRM|nr:phage baseplate assembly protein V [Desulfocucumis palustris]GBF34821.1 VgrG protein [Desulfocucumis palustris]
MSIYDSLSGLNVPANKKVYGVMVGVVTNNKDPEKLGRVKVKLPLRECQNETFWARMATLMAGNNMGSFFLPEVNDEVLVAFNEGDLHQPFVIGMLWNNKDKPPETNEDGKNNIRKIKSRSGHEIIFGDESSKESITIKTSKGHTVTMDDSGTGKIEIKDKDGKNTITIASGTNEITLNSDAKINLKSKSNSVLIDSMQNSVTIESAMQLKIKSQKIDIEAGGMMTVKSGGMLTIQGSMVKIN